MEREYQEQGKAIERKEKKAIKSVPWYQSVRFPLAFDPPHSRSLLQKTKNNMQLHQHTQPTDQHFTYLFE